MKGWTTDTGGLDHWPPTPGCVGWGSMTCPFVSPQDSAFSMSQRHSDSSVEESFPEYRFHSELRLDAKGHPVPNLPVVRSSLRLRIGPTSPSSTEVPEGPMAGPVVLSTESPVALKMGTQQLIPKGLAASSKTKTPARHQSFGAAVLSKEAARRDPQILATPSFSLDDLDMDMSATSMLRRNLRNQSYRAAMKSLGGPGGQEDPSLMTPKLQSLAEEPSQPPARSTARNKVGARAEVCPSGLGWGEVSIGCVWGRASNGVKPNWG